MQLLQGINKPEDLKALEEGDLDRLCGEIRQFLVEGLSSTGGHLASNLGVVELSVALHRVFDFYKDRLIFDVGHQSYVHKILTGRKDAFHTLRTLDGISGFPKPDESQADAFATGHASTAISVAIGAARARTHLGEDYHVVSLVGDGAMTGGLAYEGLSDAGASGEPMLVILNDNGMSIAENVGGFARYLTRLRLRPGYNRLKQGYRSTVEKLPFGQGLYRVTHRAKNRLKNLLFHCSFFEDLGFHYMGPVDGHDVKTLIRVLQWARALKEPVLLHVTTKKGKGYIYSEEDPDGYHGVGHFSPAAGVFQKPERDFSTVFGETMKELGEASPKVVAVTAAMEAGTGLTPFKEAFPERFYDVGIAEGHAVTMAAGMAKQGMVPVFAVYSSFLQRAYDMIIHDVALSHLHLVLAVDRAGLVGADGETHQGVFDAAFLCQVPGLKVYCPASYAELKEMLRYAIFREEGPVAVRYPRGAEGAYTQSAGPGEAVILSPGEHITIVTYGSMINAVIQAAETLQGRDIQAEVVKLNTIKPLDMDLIRESAARTGRILVVEDQLEAGSVGQRILAGLAGEGTLPPKAGLMNLGDRFIPHGTVGELLTRAGLDSESIARRAASML